MDPARRAELQRIAAPAAFLAAVTVAVLLIRAGLNGGGSSGSVTTLPTVVSTTTRKATTGRTTTATVAARYYTIQSGDTLGVVASRENTTVAELLRLNPGVDPTSLHVGQRIRVG